MPFLKKRLSMRMILIMLMGMLVTQPQPAQALSLCGLLCGCTMSGATVTLNGYNPVGGAATTATGSLTVSCQLLSAIGTVLVPFTVSLSKGQSNSYAARQMAGPTATMLNYNLYSDSLLRTVWGDGTGVSQLLNGSIQVSALNVLVPQIETIYAQVPASQNVPLGTYSDTITATLQF